MREITKTITLPVGEENLNFRLTKLDAFAGARLLKTLSHAETGDLWQLLLSLPDYELESMMRVCLRYAEAMLPAGPILVLSGSGWGIPDLEHDAWTCLKLTAEVIAWTLEGFFPESGSPS